MTYKTAVELTEEARARIREVSAADVIKELAGVDAPVLLDVREPNETNLGRVRGAMVIPRGQLESKIEAALPREAKIVVYCANGNRSALAADTLQMMGYANARNLIAGWTGWVGADGPVDG